MTFPGRVLVLGLALAAGAGMLVRGIAAHALTAAGRPGLVLDAAAYDRWARGVALGTPAAPSAFHLAPLYPTLAGIIYRFTPDGPQAVTALQHVAGVGLALGSGVLAAMLAGGIASSRGTAAGLLAAFLTAGSSSLVAYEHALLAEVLGAILFTIGVGVLALGAERGRISQAGAFGAGIALGLDALVRPSGLLVGLALAGWVTARAGGRRPALALLLGAALAVAPVTIRNRIVGGEWVLVTASGGFNFYVGNHPGADGGYVQPEGVHFAPGDAGDPTGRGAAERAAGRVLTAGEVSRYWRVKALDFWRRTPVDAARLLARKLALTWTQAEIPQILHVQALRREVPGFGRLPLAGPELLMPLALLGMGFATAGAVGRGPWRRRPGILLVAVALAAFTVATALFFVTDRFRIQAIPLFAVMASLGVVGFVASLRESRAEKRVAPLVLAFALALGAGLGTWPRLLGLGRSLGEPWLEPMNRAVTLAAAGGDSATISAAFAAAIAEGPDVARIHVNRGEWRRITGDLAGARADLERAVVLDPRDPAAWTALAATQVALGEPAAFASYDRARALDPSYLPAALGRGQLLLRAQRPQEALPDLRAALAGPDSAAAHDALGVAIALLGDRRMGLRHIARAVELDPDRPLYLLHLGLAEAEGGAPAQAEAAFRAALARDPHYRTARIALATFYRDQGDRARARAQVDTLRTLFPGDPAVQALAEELGSAR